MEIKLKISHEGSEVEADGDEDAVLDLVREISAIQSSLPEAVPVAIAREKGQAEQHKNSIQAKTQIAISEHRLRSVVAGLCAVVAVVVVLHSCGGKRSDKNSYRHGDIHLAASVGHGTGMDSQGAS